MGVLCSPKSAASEGMDEAYDGVANPETYESDLDGGLRLNDSESLP